MQCQICCNTGRKLRFLTERIRICQWCITDSINYRLFVLNNTLQHAANARVLAQRFKRAHEFGLISMGRVLPRLEGSELQEATEYIRWRDKHACVVCAANVLTTGLHVHHIIPLLKGGTHDPRNLATLCVRCHARQHPGVKLSVSFSAPNSEA